VQGTVLRSDTTWLVAVVATYDCRDTKICFWK